MKHYEIYFYDTEEEKLLHQGQISFTKGAGGPWKVVSSLELKHLDKRTLTFLGMIPKDHMIVLEVF